jgi:hypothetical protein
MMMLAWTLAYGAAAQEEQVKELIRIFPTAAPVSSIAELPAQVQNGIADIILSNMGTIADGLTYSHGQVLYFKNVKVDSTVADSSWVVPMYDLRFQLSDTTIGIDSYLVELRVDQKGRLLFINWPATGFSSKAELASWGDVLGYATRFAKIAKFYTPHFKAHLQFNPTLGKMVWVFRFPVTDLSRVLMFHTIEVDWQKPRLVKEYMDRYY